MGNKPVLEEKLLRFAAPALYQKMSETFSNLNIHPFDVHGTVLKCENGYELTLRFSPSFSQSATTKVSFEQALNPDEEVVRFFEETAEKCKSQLISDYYKMIKL
ncbi:type III secretion system chaperone family protein [Neobacillus vireti]|uniref:Uncharacterized protein n=1 Tax=Neobacillus vireti LMG 21834 TaxID=1131730 RepID=A0AB94IPC7_9BACI|nr:hypothetical protein [Neobacillus vireti]ETI68961.1 hypothetical protein BAVI_09376 [Neobacillus vireti LMG 21834]KLT15739.1 hypothetical protein AA980_21170 [Neobacillus vireti]